MDKTLSPPSPGNGGSTAVTRVLPPSSLDEAAAEALAEELAGQLAASWQRGRRPLTEEFLARAPALRGHRDALLRLVCEELCVRREAGQEPTLTELAGRFPEWRNELRALLDCHQLLQQEADRPALEATAPEEFFLVAELGRGAQGRVYLATQPALAERPVVLKITRLRGREHLSLARLQHTHIVPLYWALDDPARDRRTLCMPYFGTLTLEKALTDLRATPPGERTGRDLVNLLDRAAAAAPLPLPGRGPARQFLAGTSYARAACWIGACLAEALQYAHERGLVHLDLKPSNVLLAADGQPMLLDFHMAQEPVRPDGGFPEWLGGTPGHMSPEQQAAMEAVAKGLPVPAAIDGRSDLYALGLLLYRALGGADGPPGAGARRLERANPQVSPGLADLIHKCLAREPEARYASAGELAAELRRHLADLPLRSVPNRSWAERWGKWRRRRPHALGGLVLLAALATAAVGAGAHAVRQHEARVRQDLNEAATALREARAFLDRRDYGRAVESLERGLTKAQGLSEGHAIQAALEERLGPARAELRRVQRREAAASLHSLANEIRLRHTGPGESPADLHSLARACRSLWEKRGQILDRTAGNAAVERQVATDLLDVALIGAGTQVRLAPAEGPARRQALHAALQTLADGEALFGPRHALYRERQALAAALGLEDLRRSAVRDAARTPARTAWDQYAVGRSLHQAGQYAEAEGYFRRAVTLDPQGFWPNFYQGLCAYRLRQYGEAVAAFRACVSLSPATAQTYFNRALAYTDLGQIDHALEDYGHALQHDPGLAAAALNRALLRCQRKEYAEALLDLRYALDKGGDPAAVHYNSALVYLAQDNRVAALASLSRALEADPGHREARAVSERLRKGATD
jgi:tetratricopeptide (TPR) repeat protein